MAQQQIKGETGSVDGNGSLTTYTVPGTSLVTPYSVSVTADGTGASGAFLPCLTFRTITGAIIARCPAPEVAAGDTAEVSWFPHVASLPTTFTAGSTSSCQLQQSTGTDISAIADYPILFDTIYDNTWDLNPISALPPNLGLDINIGGAGHSQITALENGVWSFELGVGLPTTDAALNGSCGLERVGNGGRTFYGPAIPVSGTESGSFDLFYLPAGATFYAQVSTQTAATASPYTTLGSELVITRLA